MIASDSQPDELYYGTPIFWGIYIFQYYWCGATFYITWCDICGNAMYTKHNVESYYDFCGETCRLLFKTIDEDDLLLYEAVEGTFEQIAKLENMIDKYSSSYKKQYLNLYIPRQHTHDIR